MSQPATLDPQLVRGIDISQHQGPISWPAVAASGIGFAYIRAFEGKDPDPAFERNTREAREAGLIVGPYVFDRFRREGEVQAQIVLDALGPGEPGDLPLALDLEDLDGQEPAVAQRRLLAAVRHLRGAGVRPVLYTGPWWWREQLHGQQLAELADLPLWLADYRPRPEVPPPWGRWTIWQHIGTGGRCPGVRGDCDLDVANLAELEALVIPRPLDPGPVLDLVDETLAASISDALAADRRDH